MNIFIRSPNNTTSRKYLFSNPLKLDPNRQYEIALLSCNFNLNYINISAALGNSTFKYSSNNGTLYKTAFLEDGFYSLQELNNEINNILTTNGDNPNGIYFSPLTQSSKMRVVQGGSQSMERMVSIQSTPVQGRKLSFSVGWVGLVYRFQGDRGACLAPCTLCCLKNGPILRTRRKNHIHPVVNSHIAHTPISTFYTEPTFAA